MSEDRLLRVSLLLRSLRDVWFEPVTWSGGLRRQSVSGEGPSERVVCVSCGGEGLRRERGVPVPCEACGGRRAVLQLPAKPGRGWIVVDAYTQRPIGTSETGTSRLTRAVRCDACGGGGAFGNGRRCVRCGGSGWCEVAVGKLRAVGGVPAGSPWEWGLSSSLVAALDEGFAGAGRAYGERLRAGSYVELGRALEELRAADRGRHLLVWRVFVLGEREPESLPDLWRCRLHLGLGFLAERLPDPIRVPGWAARNERRRRDRLHRLKEAA